MSRTYSVGAAYVRWLATPDLVQTPEDLAVWLLWWKVV